MILETGKPREVKSVCPYLPAWLRLIWVDTLRRVHNAGFLVNGSYILKGLIENIYSNERISILKNFCICHNVLKSGLLLIFALLRTLAFP